MCVKSLSSSILEETKAFPDKAAESANHKKDSLSLRPATSVTNDLILILNFERQLK